MDSTLKMARQSRCPARRASYWRLAQVGAFAPYSQVVTFDQRVRSATANLSQIEWVIGRRTNERRPDQAFLYLQIASFNRVTVKNIRGKFSLHTIAELAETRVPVPFVVGEDDVLMRPKSCAPRMSGCKVRGFTRSPRSGTGR